MALGSTPIFKEGVMEGTSQKYVGLREIYRLLRKHYLGRSGAFGDIWNRVQFRSVTANYFKPFLTPLCTN